MLIDLKKYNAEVISSGATTISVTKGLMFWENYNEIRTNIPSGNNTNLRISVRSPDKERLMKILDLAGSYTEHELRTKFPELLI